MLNNNDEPQNKRKKTPLTKRVKRIFTAPKGVDAHARYAEEYYKQFRFNHQDSDEIAIIAQVEGLTQKAVAHWMADVFYQFYIQHYVSEEVKLQQSTGELQKRVRRNLERCFLLSRESVAYHDDLPISVLTYLSKMYITINSLS